MAWNRKPIKIDIRKALAMKAAGISQAETARGMGCTRAAVCMALKNVESMCLPKEQLETFRRTQADILDTVSAVYLQEQLNVDKIKATSARDAAIINGIAIEKSRLLKGESTANLAVDIRALTASVMAASLPKPLLCTDDAEEV